MRHIAFIVVLIFIAISTMAHENYIKFKEQIEINNIIFQKGEIFQKTADNKILFGKDTIEIGDAKIEPITNLNLSKISNKQNIITKSDSIYYKVILGELKINGDTIRLIKEDNSIVLFISRSEISLSIEDCGSPFRLFIPELPSIVFYKNEIPFLTNDSITENPNNDSFLGSFKLLWWHYLIAGIIGLLLLIFIYIFIRKFINNQGKEPIYEKYNDGDLNEFVERYDLSIKKLIKYNPELLGDYLSSNKREKDKIERNLITKELITGYSKKKSKLSQKHDVTAPSNQSTNNIEPLEKSQNISELSTQIHQMKMEILDKIDFLSNNKEDSKKIEDQQKKIQLLTEKAAQLNNANEKINLQQNEVASLKEKIIQLNKDIDKSTQENKEINNELYNTKEEKQKIEHEYSRYTEKVVFVEYLEPYSKAMYNYYDFCQTGYLKALDYFNKLDLSESELISLTSQFIAKFNSTIPNKTTYWVGVITEIKESKTTANIELINSLKQIQQPDDKLFEFKRILLKEVFEKYSSSFFILTEELSNLSKFADNNSNAVRDFERYFNEFKTELHNKSKTIELDLNYVPLFENYEKYAAFTKLVDKTCSLPYKSLNDIPKDSVLEVISYGFGNEETNVILA